MQSHLAVAHAKMSSTSVALFAAAWAWCEHEARERAQCNFKFWQLVQNSCGLVSCQLQTLWLFLLPSTLPLCWLLTARFIRVCGWHPRPWYAVGPVSIHFWQFDFPHAS
jgi:hypothetical protein